MNFAAGIRKTALATTIGAVALAATVGLGIDSASADNTGDGSGMTLVMFNADTGVGWYLGPDGESVWWGITSPDGSSTVYYIYYNPGNPNPDDPSSGEKGDSSMRQQLLKQLGGKLVMETPFGKTILGRNSPHRARGLTPSGTRPTSPAASSTMATAAAPAVVDSMARAALSSRG